MEFVIVEYRQCWGWAMGDERTTWLEVFDTAGAIVTNGRAARHGSCPDMCSDRNLALTSGRDITTCRSFQVHCPRPRASCHCPTVGSPGREVDPEADGLHYQLQITCSIFLHLDGQGDR